MLNASDKKGPIPIGTWVCFWVWWPMRSMRYGTIIHRKANGSRYYVKLRDPTPQELEHYTLYESWWTEWKGEVIGGVFEKRKRDLYYPNDLSE